MQNILKDHLKGNREAKYLVLIDTKSNDLILTK